MASLFILPNLILMTLFFTLTHPLSLGFTLLLVILYSSILMGLISFDLWLSYAMILILLGGLLVIFIYTSLLASNERYESSSLKNFLFFMLVIPLMIYLVPSLTSSLPSKIYSPNPNLPDLYSSELASFTIFLVLYLLLTLLITVKISYQFSLTLRSHM